MTTVQIQAMQWGDIPYMGNPDLVPFSEENDAECFREIRDVLARYGALKRFGVFLIHKHFEVTEDEELTESTEHEGRRLVIVPKKRTEIDRSTVIETNWIFTDTENISAACCTCAKNANGHLGYHRSK